jgi:hypothetical protein
LPRRQCCACKPDQIAPDRRNRFRLRIGSFERLDRRRRLGRRRRWRCGRRRIAHRVARGCYARIGRGLGSRSRSAIGNFRSRPAHAVLRGLPPIPRRAGPIDSPGPRDRRPGRIPDECPGYRADRAKDYRAGYRTQRGVAGPVLRKRSARCEQQDHGCSGEGFDHVRGPSRMKVHAGPPLWPDNETSGSIAADHCAQTSRSHG